MPKQVLVIEQAILGKQPGGGTGVLGRSPGFSLDWDVELERICNGFGERVDNLPCPQAVFAQPFGKELVAVVQVADQGLDPAGRPGPLAFRCLAMNRSAYRDLSGDPFLIAANFPPYWNVRGELPALYLPKQAVEGRAVEKVLRALKRAEGPSLLGACQALVDGAKVVFTRPAPDLDLVQSLWLLLPTADRCQLWPASFAFGNQLQFHAVVSPCSTASEFKDYITEQQAVQYPEGRYELRLQIAAESGNQRDLDALFSRRSRGETWKVSLVLLAAFLILVPFMAWLNQGSQMENVVPGLSPASDYPTLNWADHRELTKELAALADEWHVKTNKHDAETLLAALAGHLGPGIEGRDGGRELRHGPVQRRLRVLLWEHGRDDYADPKMSLNDLVASLRKCTPAKKDE